MATLLLRMAAPKKSPSLRSVPGITLLGNAAAPSPQTPSEAQLEIFENLFPARDYTITLDCPDFTSLCPVTGQPDFAHLIISYVPGLKCVETKSLKLYLASYRNQRSFNEEIINRVFSDLMKACKPRRLRVEGRFAARGGISLTVVVEHPNRKGAK
jgi:7-cyano-7-deazaguanine reductase